MPTHRAVFIFKTEGYEYGRPVSVLQDIRLVDGGGSYLQIPKDSKDLVRFLRSQKFSVEVDGVEVN